MRAAIPRGASTTLARVAPQLLLAELLLGATVLGLDIRRRVVDLRRDLDGREARRRLPRVLQHVRPEDLAVPDVLDQRHVDGVQVRVGVPVLEQVRDELGREGGCARDDARVVVAVEEGVGEGYAFDAADGGFHGAADGAAREAEDGRAVASVVGTRDHEVDGAPAREVVVQSDLHAGCRRAVDEDPFFFGRVCGERVRGRGAGVGEAAVDDLEGRGSVVGWLDGFTDEVRFADPWGWW